MEKDRRIQPGYMTVGEIAKKMGTTVRTLQYYDKRGLLSPSAASEGGRRLYTYKDMVRLHEIMSLKSLGFSLDDIKENLSSLETPEEAAETLARQEEKLKAEIERLTRSLKDMEALKQEVMQMESVNFKKYADIIVNLRMKNEYYWLIKYFDDELLDYIRKRFDEDSGLDFMRRFRKVTDRALNLKETGISLDSREAQKAAEEFWNLVLEFIDGDMTLLPKLMEFGNKKVNDHEWGRRQAEATAYLGKALEIYFAGQETGSLEEE
ncbi:MAG TPA: MerR family transcriptional regulator [Candidatus Anaerostipes avistercoris]|uniref:MerR family transcriptional regulator n=1 Tax=Candidatus Anaerostipes avistercoris TaxID=2838462 RepID=A0A9D2T8N3_9FIRM|nr:MerR family transcriptional regulator [Candidatus Anaerostipes avistercoris]